MNVSFTRTLLAGVIGSLALVEPGTAQSQTPPPTPQKAVFGESLNVALVELDVMVHDAKGEPIRGLRREDFRVLENGVERPIGGFYERSLPLPTPDMQTKSDLPSPEVGKDREGTEAAGTQDSDLSTVVVFLDHAALRPDRRARILHFLTRHLQAAGSDFLGTSTRMALVTNDLPLEVRVAPTGDLLEFLEQLNQLPKPPARSARASLDRARAAENIGGNKGQSGAPTDLLNSCSGRLTKLAEVAQYVAGVEQRNQQTLNGLDALFTILGGMPGRKAVLYVGEGLELQPGEEMALRAAIECPDLQGEMLSFASRTIANELRMLAADANAHRVTIYSIDAAGSRADENLHPQIRQARVANLQGSLALISRETGGRLFRNTGDIRWVMERLSKDLTHSYSLAYVPGNATEGALRKIKVELVPASPARLSRAKLRHRRAIRHVGTTDHLVARLFAALWLQEQDNLLEMDITATPSTKNQPQGTNSLQVDIRIPSTSLVLSEEPAPLEIRLFLMARNLASGARTLPKEHFEELSVAQVRLAQKTGWFEFSVDMNLPEGPWDVAVGVRDELTSRSAVVLLESVDVN